MSWMKIDSFVKKTIYLVNYKVGLCFYICIYLSNKENRPKKKIFKKNIEISVFRGVSAKHPPKSRVWY